MSIEKDKKRLAQKEQLEKLLKEPSPTDMLTVYLRDEEQNHHHYTINCALIPIKQKDKILESNNWLIIDVMTPFYDYENKKYFRFGDNEGIEPLIIYRGFPDSVKNYNEISEEFRLFHNLYHDQKNGKYIKFDDNGDEITIIEFEKKCIKVRVKELKEFLTVKKMYLCIRFVYDEDTSFPIGEAEVSNKNDNSRWELFYGVSSENTFYSRLVGNKLISPFPNDLKPEQKKYADFIISTDEYGNEITHTSNPDLLMNYSGTKNPKAPPSLTSIHFRKEVLDKYYKQSSKYSIEDSTLRCKGLWNLSIDNHHDDKVCVWLGDLGCNLPYKEQLHWKAYNILPTGSISDTYFKTQIMGDWNAKSNYAEHVFKSKYEDLLKISNDYLGWQILLPLNEKDSHYYESLRIPSTNEQSDFDELVLALTKVIIDSLNEKYFNKHLINHLINNETKKELNGKKIKKLELTLKELACENYKNHIQFLTDLQSLRSTGSAHRKGDNYEESAARFDVENKDLKSIFEEILHKAIAFINYLIEIIKSEKLIKTS